MSTFKTKIVAIVAIALSTLGLQAPANAAGTLSWADFQLTSGYQSIQAANAATSAYMQNHTSFRILTDTKSSMLGISIGDTIMDITTNGQASQVMVSVPVDLSHSDSYYYGYVDGKFFQPLPDSPDQIPQLTNYNAALKHLGKAGASYLITPSDVPPSDMGDIRPSALFAATDTQVFRDLGDSSEANCLFSSVTVTQNSQDSSKTDYAFVATVPASGILPAIDFNIVQTIDASGIFSSQTTSVNLSGLTAEMKTTLTFGSVPQITMPPANVSVDFGDLRIAGFQYSAQQIAVTKAKAIVAKAVVAQKKAHHSALTMNDLKTAAKSLKATYRTPTLAKLDVIGTMSGIQGIATITIVKGKAVIKTVY